MVGRARSAGGWTNTTCNPRCHGDVRILAGSDDVLQEGAKALEDRCDLAGQALHGVLRLRAHLWCESA